MDTNKMIYRDDLSPRQNFETLFNWLRFCMEQFDHGRVSADKINIADQKLNKAIADNAYLSMMSGIEIPDGGEMNDAQ